MSMVKTLKLRVKDKHAALLKTMARDVNTVFNFVNETSERAIRNRQEWLGGFALQKLTAGYSKCEGVSIGSGTVAAVCREYARKRDYCKKTRLNWRVSNAASAKYSLGWIPFRDEGVKYKSGRLQFAGHLLGVWDSYGLSAYKFLAGSFSEDARGRWYFNVTVEAQVTVSNGTAAVGIDLGLKTAVTTSSGATFIGRAYRASEAKLVVVQRAGKKRRARTIHAKIKNQRKDGLHKFSTALVKNNAAIFVGDVSSEKLVKTKMAKSTLDAGWSIFKTMLEYKSRQAGIVFEVVNEAYSTQTCSQCGSIEGPKGLSGLGIREWTCSCGAVHERDINAARNILRVGLDSLEAGALKPRSDQKSRGVARSSQEKDAGRIRALAAPLSTGGREG